MRKLFALTAAFLLASPAVARYVGTEQIQYSQEIQDWIKNLKSKKQSSPCCDLSDGDFTSMDIRLGADGKSHFFATIEGEWVEIPDDALVTEPNRIGRPIVWYVRWMGLEGKMVTLVRCFLPGAMG